MNLLFISSVSIATRCPSVDESHKVPPWSTNEVFDWSRLDSPTVWSTSWSHSFLFWFATNVNHHLFISSASSAIGWLISPAQPQCSTPIYIGSIQFQTVSSDLVCPTVWNLDDYNPANIACFVFPEDLNWSKHYWSVELLHSFRHEAV